MSEADFEAAAAQVKAFTQRPTNEELLQLYGLYKQAKEGDNNTGAPWAVQFEAKAKWDAWTAKKGTSKEDARAAYIKLANELAAKYKTPNRVTTKSKTSVRPSPSRLRRMALTLLARCKPAGGTLCVVGNIPQLGNWDVSNAVQMIHVPDDPSNELFRLTIEVPLGSQIQYRYMIQHEHRFVMERSDVARNVRVDQSPNHVQDDGPLRLDVESLIYEHGFLNRAVQLRVYIKKEGASGPISKVHIPGFAHEDYRVSVKSDSPGHRRSIVEDGVWILHASQQVPLSFTVEFTSVATGDLIGRAWIGHSELVEKRGTLSRAIIGTSLTPIGELTVSYLVITPFVHANNSVELFQRPFPRAALGPLVIGHRGYGSTNNLVDKKQRRKYGIATENTLSSFLTAAKRGVTWVEFDVQLTKDNIPVLVHDEDITVSSSSSDGSPIQLRVPVNKLNLEKLRKLRAVMPEPSHTSSGVRRRRSLTDIRDESGSESDLSTPVVHKNWERSVWARLDGYPTLAEMFQHVPAGVGFNVEIKWPDEDITVAQYGLAERNFYVDTILQCLFQHAGDRPLILSSFDPSICLLARHKQLRYPVYFLTASGWEMMSDERKNTLEASIAFAKRADLHGVVSESHAIVANPMLIRTAHDAGLTLLSYGQLNNVPAHVALQVEHGIDAIISDELEAIRSAVKRPQQTEVNSLPALAPMALKATG